jgi:hypothetical protein
LPLEWKPGLLAHHTLGMGREDVPFDHFQVAPGRVVVNEVPKHRRRNRLVVWLMSWYMVTCQVTYSEILRKKRRNRSPLDGKFYV